MFRSFRFEGWEIFENSTSIKSWPLKSVSLFYIDIRFPISVNEGHSVDIQFCTHDLIKEDDWNDYPCTQKIMIELHALIHSLHVIKMIFRFQQSQWCVWFPNQTVKSKDIT